MVNMQSNVTVFNLIPIWNYIMIKLANVGGHVAEMFVWHEIKPIEIIVEKVRIEECVASMRGVDYTWDGALMYASMELVDESESFEWGERNLKIMW